MTTARYDINSANVNRVARFHVEADGGPTANTFFAIKGAASAYPFYGQLAGVPTVEQELGQLRLSLVQRALSAYAITVSLNVEAGGSFYEWAFEQDEMGAFFNQLWTGDTSLDKHVVADRTDLLGTGGMTVIKTKPGLQSLCDSLSTVSFDGGTTGPFGALSTGGTVTLPDGRVVTTGAAAPALPATNPAGLVVTWVS
jgi:hypothetical protein